MSGRFKQGGKLSGKGFAEHAPVSIRIGHPEIAHAVIAIRELAGRAQDGRVRRRRRDLRFP